MSHTKTRNQFDRCMLLGRVCFIVARVPNFYDSLAVSFLDMKYAISSIGVG